MAGDRQPLHEGSDGMKGCSTTTSTPNSRGRHPESGRALTAASAITRGRPAAVPWPGSGGHWKPGPGCGAVTASSRTARILESSDTAGAVAMSAWGKPADLMLGLPHGAGAAGDRDVRVIRVQMTLARAAWARAGSSSSRGRRSCSRGVSISRPNSGQTPARPSAGTRTTMSLLGWPRSGSCGRVAASPVGWRRRVSSSAAG
jgi:hypothetical protein